MNKDMDQDVYSNPHTARDVTCVIHIHQWMSKQCSCCSFVPCECVRLWQFLLVQGHDSQLDFASQFFSSVAVHLKNEVISYGRGMHEVHDAKASTRLFQKCYCMPFERG